MNGKFLELTPNMKRDLLEVPAMDVRINNEKSPLMVAVQRTTASLAKCFEGKQRKILFPDSYKIGSFNMGIYEKPIKRISHFVGTGIF